MKLDNLILYEVFSYIEETTYVYFLLSLNPEYVRYQKISQHVSQYEKIFYEAVIHGEIETCKLIDSIFNLTREDIKNMKVCSGIASKCSEIACKHLNVLKWLHSTYKLKREDIFTNDDISALIMNGPTYILKWYYDTFGNKYDYFVLCTTMVILPFLLIKGN